MKHYLAIACCAGLAACTWVKPVPGSESISLVKEAHVAQCEKIGVATARTKASVAGLHRKPDKVADELLTLARSQAFDMGGDSIVSQGAPEQGMQKFKVFKCKS